MWLSWGCNFITLTIAFRKFFLNMSQILLFVFSWSIGLNTYSAVTESRDPLDQIFIQHFKSFSCNFLHLTSIGGQKFSLYNTLISNPRFSLTAAQLSVKFLISLGLSALIYWLAITLPKILNYCENWMKICIMSPRELKVV